jgi:yeast amino acid transporter
MLQNIYVACSFTNLSRVYAFGGTELVGVTVAEARNPRIAMPKAVKMTFFRIAFFYIASVFFLGMVVPYNSRELAFALKATTSAAASPFVVAIKNAQIRGLDHVINASLLIFVISASVSGKHFLPHFMQSEANFCHQRLLHLDQNAP